MTHVDLFVIDIQVDPWSVLSLMDWSVRVDYFVIWTHPSLHRDESGLGQSSVTRKVTSLLATQGFLPVIWSFPSWHGGNGTMNTTGTGSQDTGTYGFENVFAERPRTNA